MSDDVRLEDLDDTRFVSMVSDGALASPLAVEGLLVPVVILDTTERPDIDENIRMHEIVGSGDAGVRWGVAGGRVAMLLDFRRPIETLAAIVFDVAKEGIVVDSALRSRAIYIQGGKPGDRLATTLDHPRILVQLADVGFADDWDAIFHKEVETDFRMRGLSKPKAHAAAGDAIEALRSTFGFRMT